MAMNILNGGTVSDMARYTDLDKIIAKLDADTTDPNEMFPIHWMKTWLNMQPTADVAPRSEVDKWYHEYHVIKDELKQEKAYHRETEKSADRYFTELQEAKKERDEYKKHVDEDIIYVRRIKSEVAREIFADLWEMRIPEESTDGLAYYFDMAELIELKKKYTEPDAE